MSKHSAIVLWGLLLSAIPAQSQPTNIRIYPSSVTQTEPVIAVSPVDTNLLFASAFTINTSTGFRSEGVYVSTNGGITWRGNDTCTGQLISNHNGDPGVMIHSSGRFILTHIGSVFPGVYSHYSTNQGLTWSNAYTISSDQPEDKGSFAIDNDPASPYYGRLYTAWVRFLQPYPVSFSYSSDAGTSWVPAFALNGTPPARCSGGTIATGRDGRVYVTWAGLTASPPFIEDFVGFAVSTDGGATWRVTQNAYDMNGITGTLPAKGNIRVNGLPQIAVDNSGGLRHNWLYIVTTERDLAPAGSDPDIILHRSTDGGATWSAGIRVNQDPINNGKIQYFPAIDVDRFGGINIIYYDDRFTSSDSAEIIYARSMDGGITWTERVISNHRFKPKPIVGGPSSFQGDHIALKAVGSRLYALWMDDFAGLYQVWLAVMPLSPTAVQAADRPEGFRLQQNSPNPFNPSTRIAFSVPDSRSVTLKVFDLQGREVATLMNERLKAGSYAVTFDAPSLASGVYLYELRARNEHSGEEFRQAKKMLLLR